jgi:hypothetical protein
LVTRRPRILKLEQPLVELLDTAEQLASLPDLTGISKRIAALDQGEQFAGRFGMESDAVMHLEGRGDWWVLKVH